MLTLQFLGLKCFAFLPLATGPRDCNVSCTLAQIVVWITIKCTEIGALTFNLAALSGSFMTHFKLPLCFIGKKRMLPINQDGKHGKGYLLTLLLNRKLF